MESRSTGFYNRQWGSSRYGTANKALNHEAYSVLSSFVKKWGLQNKRCLEIGAGKGLFQDLVSDYVGIDLAEVLGRHFRKPFACSSATALPFPDETFDAVWTLFALEHVTSVEQAFSEIRRVLRNDGILLLWPAWYCRPWRADGYEVRPYSDFGMKGKLIKGSIPLRNSAIFRACYVLPRRLIRLISHRVVGRPVPLKYRQLKANLETFWLSDSDACNSIDPFDAILWFTSRGDECLSSTGALSRLLVRTGALVIKVQK